MRRIWIKSPVAWFDMRLVWIHIPRIWYKMQLVWIKMPRVWIDTRAIWIDIRSVPGDPEAHRVGLQGAAHRNLEHASPLEVHSHPFAINTENNMLPINTNRIHSLLHEPHTNRQLRSDIMNLQNVGSGW